MTQPNEQLIEEIRIHLEQSPHLMRLKLEIGEEPGEWDMYVDQYSTIAKGLDLNDAHFFSLAYQRLRALLEERRFYKEDRDRCERLERKAHEQLQQTREELERLKEACDGYEMSAADAIAERNDLQVELEQVKADRDYALHGSTCDACRGVIGENDKLRTELSAKDRVFAQLKEIECTIGRFSEDRASFVGQRVTQLYEEMKSILSQYKGAEPNGGSEAKEISRGTAEGAKEG